MTNNTTTITSVNVPVTNQTASLASSAPNSQTSDMSPLTAILSLLVLIAIPALIYAFFFSINCPRIPRRRSSRRSETVDLSHNKDSKQMELVSTSGVKYKKDADDEKEYGSECPVCLSVFVEGDLVRQLNACKHSFHVACINKWLCSHSNCPVCRASVPSTTPTGRSKRPAPGGDDDFRQGLPDAASLV